MFNFLKKRVSPFKEAGTSGTAIYGGYIVDREKSKKLQGSEKWVTAADIMANLPIVSGSIRYYISVAANSEWSVKPADESPEAERMAEFVDSVMYDMTETWASVVRRSAMFKYYGFSIDEWTAKKREDGLIGLYSIERRPQHTIERWEVDERGEILGVWQRSPQDGTERFIPIWKCVYITDSAMTDSPEGLGWFRSLAEPAERMKLYQNLEAMGFQRDLSGIPVGRAPYSEVARRVSNGEMTEADGRKILSVVESFVSMQTKAKTTGIVLDSAAYQDMTADGEKNSAKDMWGVELLTGSSTSMDSMQHSIERLNKEMALVIGTSSLLVGEDGAGSLALAKEKNTQLYQMINSALTEMAEQMSKSIIEPLWKLNGFDPKLMPYFEVSDISFRDVEAISAALRDMASAGAPLLPDDPVIEDVRMLLGVSKPLEGMTNDY